MKSVRECDESLVHRWKDENNVDVISSAVTHLQSALLDKEKDLGVLFRNRPHTQTPSEIQHPGLSVLYDVLSA